MSGSSIENLLVLNLTVMILICVVGFRYAVKEIKQVHKMLNNRMDELISLASKVARTAGIEEERERGRAQKRN